MTGLVICGLLTVATWASLVFHTTRDRDED
jgi:hypothetical protein